MPDDELPDFDPMDNRLSELAARLASPTFDQGSGDIGERLWPHFLEAAAQLVADGEDPKEVETALETSRLRHYILPDGRSAALPAELHDEIAAAFAADVAEAPEGALQRLDEKWVKEIAEFRMEVFHNESKHRGFPHVRIQLEGGAINVSIGADPKVIAGRRGLRDEAAALKCVKRYRKRLKAIWDATRPDDQKLPKPTPAGPAARSRR